MLAPYRTRPSGCKRARGHLQHPDSGCILLRIHCMHASMPSLNAKPSTPYTSQRPSLHLCTITTARCHLFTRHCCTRKVDTGRSARTETSAAWLQTVMAISGARTCIHAPTGISTSAWYQAYSNLPHSPAISIAAPIMAAGTRHLLGRSSAKLHDSVGPQDARALDCLRSDKAAGVEGIGAEQLLVACELLLELMGAAFTHLLLERVPECL